MSALAIAVLWMTNATAEEMCKPPEDPLPVPDGSTATRQEMMQASARMRAYNERVEDYLRCLRGEAGQAGIGQDAEARQSLYEARKNLHNAAVDKLTGLSNCLNVEIRKFKATGGGSHAAPADCTTALAAASAGAQSNAATAGKVLATVVPGKASPTSDGGSWDSVLQVGGGFRPCPLDRQKSCTVNVLTVRNDSSRSLECSSKLTYPIKNGAVDVTIQKSGVVGARTQRALIKDLALPGEPAGPFEVTCSERQPLSDLPIPAECKFRITQSVALSNYYPPASRRLEEEGPVVVEFTLPEKNSAPTQVTVVEGSLFSRLDDAAVRAVKEMSMSTDCPKQRFRFRVTFELDR